MRAQAVDGSDLIPIDEASRRLGLRASAQAWLDSWQRDWVPDAGPAQVDAVMPVEACIF